MLMPFGKFKGVEVDDLPEWYIEWLYHECDLREPLLSEVRRSLGHLPHNNYFHVTITSTDLVRDIYRELSKEFHPDLGKWHYHAQAAINNFKDRLMAEIKR
jgi:hypothetical protein